MFIFDTGSTQQLCLMLAVSTGLNPPARHHLARADTHTFCWVGAGAGQIPDLTSGVRPLTV